MKKIYFDNASTTKIADEVIKAMVECEKNFFAVPAETLGHSMSMEAKKILEDSRDKIARSIGAEPEEIIFTSGGTESNNLAIIGTLKRLIPQKPHIITTKVEHESVLNPIQYMEKTYGLEVTYLPVDKNGLIDLEFFKEEIRENTIFVSIQHANQETGVVQPVKEIAEICAEKGIIFHTDAVQSYLKVPLNVREMPITLLSLSAHLIHGPKGVGALFIRKGTKIEKVMYGGYNEYEIRPGTENLPGIYGFAKAVEIWRKEDAEKIKSLRDYFEKRVFEEIEYAVLNGDKKKRAPHISNISFRFIEGESVLLSLDFKGIEVATGSACFSKALEASYVLLAMGKSHEESHGSIRFSFSKYNTQEEVDFTLDVLKETVEKLRKLSPLKEV